MPLLQFAPSIRAANFFPIAGATAKDWTRKYNSTYWPVRYQGYCGSCWAFSTIGTLEANLAIKKSLITPYRFSEQQLVDCVTTNLGCSGGWPKNAFLYLGASGVATGANYPYLGANGTCKTSVAKTKYLISPYTQLVGTTSVTSTVVSKTLSVCVHANSGWFSYASGIYGACAYPVPGYNHAVVLVGVDSAGNFKIRNSWGSGWGEKGHMRISASLDCGVKNVAYIPVL